MANTWFRMYAEWADDPEVQMMSEAMQRRLAMLFCLRCKETLQERSIAFQLRISDEDLAATKALFVEKGFIDEAWNLLNWNKRQYLSDSSSERVRRHREARKQDGTLQKRDQAVAVTPPEADTEAETDKKQKPPRKRVVPLFVLPEWVPSDPWECFAEMRKKKRAPLTDGAAWLTVAELDKLRASGQDPGAVLNQSTQRGWQGVFALSDGHTAKKPPTPPREDTKARWEK